ncbi:MAG: helix-turn-helix transcriptional regulator [Lentisphaeria bacterium]|nr:helix-turn-helix transcriptional regulator [Lentisphaeria bacterium]
MSIIYFDTMPRLSSRIEPLNRAGWLEYKDYSVDRRFDHLSFSYRVGAPEMEFQVEMNGRKKVLTQPHCMLMMPGDHTVTTALKPCHELYFVFEHPERILGGKPPVYRDFGLMMPPQNSIFFEYAENFKRLLYVPITPAVCTQLDCLALAMLSATFYSENSSGTASPIEQIEGYINNHYSDQLDFQFLAHRFGMSFSNFRKQWQMRHDLPPGATVANLRNRHARELLLNERLSIGEVAVMSGYPDARYFSRFFRKMNGMTPGEFRMLDRKEK